TIEWLKNRYSLTSVGESQNSLHDTYTKYAGTFSNESGTIAVVVMVNSVNLRFGQTVNSAVEIVKTDTFLLLNNDVEPLSDLIEVLQPFFADPAVFAVGCHELEGKD